MWRKKRFIIGLLAAVILVSASIGGVALAQDNEEDTGSDSLLGRVAEILGIEQQRVEDAFTRAQAEMKEAALDRYLQNLVDKGIIAEERAAEYREWLKSRPDMSELRQKMKDWIESQPDISDGTCQGNLRGFKAFGDFRGKGGMRGFGGLNLPSE